jgi:hypothetical protein
VNPAAASLLALWTLGLGACLNSYPQRVPGPLVLPEAPAAAETTEAGPAPGELLPMASAVVVQRDSDPVWVRRPGERGDYALPFYRKRERVDLLRVVL